MKKVKRPCTIPQRPSLLNLLFSFNLRVVYPPRLFSMYTSRLHIYLYLKMESCCTFCAATCFIYLILCIIHHGKYYFSMSFHINLLHLFLMPPWHSIVWIYHDLSVLCWWVVGLSLFTTKNNVVVIIKFVCISFQHLWK